jgi:hypothetical protein
MPQERELEYRDHVEKTLKIDIKFEKSPLKLSQRFSSAPR